MLSPIFSLLDFGIRIQKSKPNTKHVNFEDKILSPCVNFTRNKEIRVLPATLADPIREISNLGLLAKHSHFIPAIPSHNYLPRSRICSIPCFGGWAFCLKSPRLYCHLLLLPPPPPLFLPPPHCPFVSRYYIPSSPPFPFKPPPSGYLNIMGGISFK